MSVFEKTNENDLKDIAYFNHKGEIIGGVLTEDDRKIRKFGNKYFKDWAYYCEMGKGVGSHRIGAPIKVNEVTGDFSYTGFMLNVNQLTKLAKGYDDVIMTGNQRLELRLKNNDTSVMVPLAGKYNGDVIINIPEIKKSSFYNPKDWVGYLTEYEASYYFEGYAVDKETGEIIWNESPDEDKSFSEENERLRQECVEIAMDRIKSPDADEIIYVAKRIHEYIKQGK